MVQKRVNPLTETRPYDHGPGLLDSPLAHPFFEQETTISAAKATTTATVAAAVAQC